MAMDSNDISNVLNTFAQWPRSFSIEEISNFLEDPVDKEVLHHALLNDSRFVYLTQDSQDRSYIPQKTLLKWLFYFNKRLAEINKFRLDEYQLALAISCLRRHGQWHTLPKQALELGQSLGLIAPAWTPRCYVFPIAWVLNYQVVKQSALESVIEKLDLGSSLEQIQKEATEVVRKEFSARLSQCNDRQLSIVRYREGLETGDTMTLRQVAYLFNLTAERIRQLESKFWDELQYRPKRQSARRWLLEWLLKSLCSYNNDTCSSPWSFREAGFIVILCEVMNKQGSLIIEESAPEADLIELMAKITRVPYTSLSNLNLAILTESSDAQSLLKLPSLSLPEKANAFSIAARIESQSWVPFTKQDVIKLANSLARSHREHLDLDQRVYLALHSIGHPAHYSDIARIHNTLFPEHYTSERNVHAALNREQHGVVWIGIRGTFALKEWGYERPPKSLYEAVAEIVQKKFNKTGKPVPFTVIAAEIGKYRKIVKPSSLVFAAHCNPKLQRVSKDSFVPKSTSDQDHEEITLNELDKILKEFEQSKGSIKSEC